MQAQRKLQQPAPAQDEDGWSPRLADAALGDASPSPAHLLWDQLAARLQEQPAAAAPVAAVRAEVKWPMPVRLATIMGLSLAGWGVIYWAIAGLL